MAERPTLLRVVLIVNKPSPSAIKSVEPASICSDPQISANVFHERPDIVAVEICCGALAVAIMREPVLERVVSVYSSGAGADPDGSGEILVD